MNGTSSAFAVWLRTQRRLAGLSQQAVADGLKGAGFAFHQTQIAKIERGAREVSLAEAAAFVQLFGTTLDEALGLKSGPGSVAADRAARQTILLRQIQDAIAAELPGGAS